MSKGMVLILGGARSGKSAYAQARAAQAGGGVLYVATATAGDEEMAARIAAHRAERPPRWETLEAPRRVGEALLARPQLGGIVLIDCLTLLANNVFMDLPETAGEAQAQAALDAEVDGILRAFAAAGDGEWLIVSNEVGLGLVPPYPLGRLYRDVLGRANQRLAREASEVLFMVAGLPMKVK